MYRVLLLLLQHLLTLVFAIEVTPNSGCSSVCMNNPRSNPASVNSSQTRPTDIVCNDWELSGQNSTPIGRVFHDCVQCEENSTAFDKHSNENDVFWFLCKSSYHRLRFVIVTWVYRAAVNVKYSIVFCVFNFQNPNSSTQSEQCGEVCRGPSDTMELALVDKILVGNFDLRYHYCDDHNGSFTENLDSCMDCLEHVPASNALVNCGCSPEKFPSTRLTDVSSTRSPCLACGLPATPSNWRKHICLHSLRSLQHYITTLCNFNQFSHGDCHRYSTRLHTLECRNGRYRFWRRLGPRVALPCYRSSPSPPENHKNRWPGTDGPKT